MSKKILLLAGTFEARELATALRGMQEFSVTASLAGATRDPVDLGVEMRSGGFGGAQGLRDYLVRDSIDILIDATHPFAARMTKTAVGVATALNLPHAILQRPGWQAQLGDIWHFVDRLEDAAGLIPQHATVFIGTGRQTLTAFENLAGRTLICRRIDPPDRPFPFPRGRYQIGRPPFSLGDEVALFKQEGIDWLVVKNSGGDNSRSKLDAARQLRLPVILQRRPPLPGAQVFGTVADTINWLKGLQ